MVTKVVLPVAGLGTRFLPATKAVPKELMPVVDRPAIQYVVEECVRAGLDDVLLVTAEGKGAIVDHFDRRLDLEQALADKGKTDDLALVRSVAEIATLHSVRQGEALGLGHAILQAATHVGDDSFAVCLSDDIIDPATPFLERMIAAHLRTGVAVVALMEVPDDQVHLYGVADAVPGEEDGEFLIRGLVEKPTLADAPSNLIVVGRYVLPGEIFAILRETPPGRGGEIQIDRRVAGAGRTTADHRDPSGRAPSRHGRQARLPQGDRRAGRATRRSRAGVPGVAARVAADSGRHPPRRRRGPGRRVSGFVGRGRHDVVTRFELTSVEDHLDRLLELLPHPDPIDLRLLDAIGLVLAADVESRVSLPSFPNSAMDGYAVDAADIASATVDTPVELQLGGEVVAGQADVPNVSRGRCVRIMTGAPLPPGADAVVPVETTSASRTGSVVFHRAYTSGTNIRRVGEDLAPGQPLVAAGRRLSPADVALLANAGESRVPCNPPPRVVVLSTGDELVPHDREPGPGQIRDGNGPMLAALVRQAGGVPFSAGIVPDDRKALMYALDTNLGHADLVLCTGGASAGTRDLLPEVIGALGEVQTAKVAMQPGMPQILGRIRDTPIVGLPGNPVSAFVSFEVFVRPALRAMQGRRDVARPSIRAEITAAIASPPDKRSFARVRLAHDAGRWTATPTGAQGSHMVTSIALADGLAIVPEDVTEAPAGSQLDVQLLVD